MDRLFVAFILLHNASPAVPENDPNLNCGAYCLYCALRSLDVSVAGLPELEKRLGPVPPRGYSFADLEKGASSHGINVLGVQTSLEALARRRGRFACIALIDNSHFVCIDHVTDRSVFIYDPPRPVRVEIPVETFKTSWKGAALLLSSEPLLPESQLGHRIPVAGIACLLLVIALVAIVLKRRWKKHVKS